MRLINLLKQVDSIQYLITLDASLRFRPRREQVTHNPAFSEVLMGNYLEMTMKTLDDVLVSVTVSMLHFVLIMYLLIKIYYGV